MRRATSAGQAPTPGDARSATRPRVARRTRPRLRTPDSGETAPAIPTLRTARSSRRSISAAVAPALPRTLESTAVPVAAPSESSPYLRRRHNSRSVGASAQVARPASVAVARAQAVASTCRLHRFASVPAQRSPRTVATTTIIIASRAVAVVDVSRSTPPSFSTSAQR